MAWLRQGGRNIPAGGSHIALILLPAFNRVS